MIKKGDTLIEVTLAVGIFSMVAIAIVAVMSSGVSGAQTALETTLAREEIDAQAEALRFIQASYIADKNTDDKSYQNLWEKITRNAVEIREGNEDHENLLHYTPSTCSELYTNGEVANFGGFVIDYRNLGVDASSALISAKDDSGKFHEASTYPRLIYTKNDKTDDQMDLTADISNYKLFRAEGIYVIAVKDSSLTNIVTNIGEYKKSAFYDFYIRTCWYGSNANEPSTISTVIRLYDPDAI